MDEYLNVENSYQRLKKEFLEYGRLIIAYDLDCTVYDYHHTGESFEMVKDLIRKYRDHAYFIVFTSSPSDRYEEIKEILNKEKVPLIQSTRMLHLLIFLLVKSSIIYF